MGGGGGAVGGAGLTGDDGLEHAAVLCVVVADKTKAKLDGCEERGGQDDEEAEQHHHARHHAHHIRVAGTAIGAGGSRRSSGAARHEASELELVDREAPALYGSEATTTLGGRRWQEVWVLGLNLFAVVAHRHVQRKLERDAPLDGE
jgi:hypothetical protein